MDKKIAVKGINKNVKYQPSSEVTQYTVYQHIVAYTDLYSPNLQET